MKKILQTILIIVLVLLLSGCGELSLRVEKPNSGGSAGGNANGSDLSDSEALKNDPDAFTVTIRYEGKQYKPKKKDEMKARWTDGYSVFIADFADDGVARVAGLDGDYRVTLEGLPSGYVYDPNAYTATNDQRQIIIDIYKPIKVSGLGPHEFNCIEIRKTGVYRVELKSASQKVFFEYAPETSGTYSVESWVSTSDSQYNPKVDVYTGTIAYKQYAYTLDDGGYCKGYTKNFKHIVEIADEQISGSGGGQVVFTFAVHIDSKNSVYPVYLDFAVKLNGGFSLGYGDHEMIIPTESFEYTPEYSPSEYYWKWAETDTQGVEGRYEFDGKMFKLFEKDEDIDGDGIGDGDGYYHLYDEATNTYGAILYAKINQACRFLDLDFTHIEDPGNKSLTVNRTENHKLFIQGLSALLVDQPGDAGMYFCLPECPCLKKHTCTEKCEFPCENAATCFGACPESCLKCDPDCRRLPDWVFDVLLSPTV